MVSSSNPVPPYINIHLPQFAKGPLAYPMDAEMG